MYVDNVINSLCDIMLGITVKIFRSVDVFTHSVRPEISLVDYNTLPFKTWSLEKWKPSWKEWCFLYKMSKHKHVLKTK